MENINVEIFLICPITTLIFEDPVVASDGYTYERKAIVKWLVDHDTSPLTRDYISNSLLSNEVIKTVVQQYKKKFPDYGLLSYSSDKEFLLKSLLKSDFSQIKNYKQFDLNDMFKTEIDNICIVEHIFSKCKDSNVLKHFVNNCLDIYASNNNGEGIIHFICRYCEKNKKKSLDMYDHIVSKNICLNVEDKKGRIPLHYIITYSTRLDIALDLINRTDNLNHATKSGKTALHYACKYGCAEIIKMLIDKNVYLNCITKKKCTPLHYICEQYCNSAIYEMIDGTTDINSKNYNGETPLYLACRYSDINTIKYLIGKGADSTLTTNTGNTISHAACKRMQPDIIKYLTDKQAFINVKNSKGILPVYNLLKQNPNAKNSKSKINTCFMYIYDVYDTACLFEQDKFHPFRVASKQNNYSILKILFKKNILGDEYKWSNIIKSSSGHNLPINDLMVFLVKLLDKKYEEIDGFAEKLIEPEHTDILE